MRALIVEQRLGETEGPDLMSRVGRWRHLMLPFDELVPLPIVWEEQKVVVGELARGQSGILVA